MHTACSAARTPFVAALLPAQFPLFLSIFFAWFKGYCVNINHSRKVNVSVLISLSRFFAISQSEQSSKVLNTMVLSKISKLCNFYEW